MMAAVGLRRSLVRSELLSMRSTPTAMVLLAGSIVMALASCVANLAIIESENLADAYSLQVAMHASTVPTLVFALVAGIVSATSDFRFARIDQLLLSEPRRARLLGAKAGVGAIVGMVYGLIGGITAIAAVAAFYAYRGVGVDLASELIVRPVIGVVVGAGLLAVAGIGIGTAIKNQPAAVAGSLALMLIVEPTALLGLPTIGRWLPGASGLALTASPDPDLLSPVGGGLLLLGWTALALVIGNDRLRRADL